ncbi:MAG: hypothetical protein ACOCSA_03040 [Candidatus Hadarchaeota archaeon]
MTYPVWLSEDAVEERKQLTDSQERKLIWWKEKLEKDVTAGDNIRKSKIPDSLKDKYGIGNLSRIEFPEGWRGLYTIASEPGKETTVTIMRILSHKEYDELFGYSTS